MYQLKTVPLRNYHSQQYQHDAELNQVVLLLDQLVVLLESSIIFP
jgi:hypothetical protein